MENRYELSDEQWELIEELLPPEHGKGCPYRSHRDVVNAMLWILNTGAPWRDLPERFPPWKTVYNRFNRWCKEGLFDKIIESLQLRLNEDGYIDHDFWCIDGSSIRAHAASAGGGKKGAIMNR